MIQRKTAWLQIFWSILWGTAIGCAVGYVVEGHAVTVVHTNDVFGEIEPCGCRANPEGGMTRKANLLKTLTDPFVLQLDAGDQLFATSDLPGILREQAELQAKYLLKALALVHQDAAVPGEKDFALGFKVFEKLRKGSKIQFLAANLVKKNGAAYLPAHQIFSGPNEAGTLKKVAVIGLVGTKLKWPNELNARSIIEAASREVKALKGKADWIVALTHQGLDEDQLLAKKVPGIDLIIGGHTQSFLQQPIKIGSTWIVQSSFKNQNVGIFSLGKPLTASAYRLVSLDPGFESPPDKPSEMDGLVKEFKAAIAEFNIRKDALLRSTPPSQPVTQKFQTFSRCAECHLKQFDFWRQTQHAKALNSLVQKDQAGNKECLTCHTVGLGDPVGLSRVDRLAEYTRYDPKQTAESEEHSLSPEILSTAELNTFLQAMTGAKSLSSMVKLASSDTEARPLKQALHSLTRSWAPVQCENCHQPAGGHPFSGTYSKNVEKTVCLSCHNSERAPTWYTKAGQPNWALIDDKRRSVTCPAGELDESVAD